MPRTISLAVFLLLLPACAFNQPRIEPETVTVTVAKSDPMLEEVVNVDTKIGETDATSLAPETTTVVSHPAVLLEVNQSVQKWIEFFSGKSRETFSRFLERGANYKNMVQGILKEYGVPEEFYYLAMIESGYVTHAASPQHAVGIWQFVRPTGQRYGLRADHSVDERRDPIRATRAAALYLTDLHNIFGSWHLALCAYNAGEGRIMRAIMRGKSRDFWTLVEKKVLPKETGDYVPKFMAAAIIGNNPTRYGFAAYAAPPRPEVVAVEVAAPVRLSQVASAAGVSLAELKQFNPNLLREHTPASRSRGYPLWLPKDQARLAKRQLATLTTVKMKPVAVQYRVKSGDTLIGIADRFGLSLAGLKKLNRLGRGRIRSGQVLKVASRS